MRDVLCRRRAFARTRERSSAARRRTEPAATRTARAARYAPPQAAERIKIATTASTKVAPHSVRGGRFMSHHDGVFGLDRGKHLTVALLGPVKKGVRRAADGEHGACDERGCDEGVQEHLARL